MAVCIPVDKKCGVWIICLLGLGGGGGGVCEGTSLHKRYKYVPSQRVGF